MRILEKIIKLDKHINQNFELINTKDREFVSKNVLNDLRSYVEHIMFYIYINDQNLTIEHNWDNIKLANKYIYGRGEYKFLKDFHFYLQSFISHFIPIDDSAERLMLKYYVHLVKLKEYMQDNYNLILLDKLSLYPLNQDSSFDEYYSDILDRLEKVGVNSTGSTSTGRFYILKKKTIVYQQSIFYELTLSPANDYASKFDRVIAFTKIDIIDNYAVKVGMKTETIRIFGKDNPINIVDNYHVSIRECEFNNFFAILGIGNKVKSSYREYFRLMQYITSSNHNLLDLVTMDSMYYEIIKAEICDNLRATYIFDSLDFCRKLIDNNISGVNVVRYLLYTLNNKIIKNQTELERETSFAPLNIINKSFPFEKTPFNSSLYNHNPRLIDVVASIPTTGRESELFARKIRNNTENNRILYTPLHTLDYIEDIDSVIKDYNRSFTDRFNSRRITKNGKYIYINSYEENTIDILRILQEYSQEGLEGYKESFFSWIDNNPSEIDCIEKKEILENLFVKTSLGMIFGAAGTGKTTIMKYISSQFSLSKKLFLANTHPALSNLKSRIGENNYNSFSTVSSYKKKNDVGSYDIIFIDECSTISNRDMLKVLEKAKCDLLVLAGDIYQIESISFGNWFNIAKEVLPSYCINELYEPYRTKNSELIQLWGRVRTMKKNLVEFINAKNYSQKLNEKILERTSNDEIILCLNYDGLYGINNINRYLQNSNSNISHQWGLNCYKIDDPIIFNDSQRFSPLVHNNMKGRIIKIEQNNSEIEFDIKLDIAINAVQAKGYDFELKKPVDGKSVISFKVTKNKDSEYDNDYTSASSLMPFQIAYAVSIHKSQGLEYDSVKIVFTKEVEEFVSHNLFYTAITRTKNMLKIYWTPECEVFITENMEPVNSKRDANIIKSKL